MPAIINYKICDQANACGGISACPVGAFSYNDKKKHLEIDNDKCISCGKCVGTCPIGAIGVAKTQEEFEDLKQIIENDPRSSEDLFVDRFGADIISNDKTINFTEINSAISSSSKLLIEIFNDDSIQCLLKSIPYSEIAKNTEYTNYLRSNIEDKDGASFGIKSLPCLLVCDDGKIKKVINKYYELDEKQKLFEEIKR